jgi:hypothetical protein
MAKVRVRAETAIPGLGWHEIGEVERDDSIDGAIEDGRLTIVDEDGEPTEQVLRGEALTKALKQAGLPTTGGAEEKRARLAEHRSAQRLEAAGLGEQGGPGTVPTGGPAPGGFAPGTQTAGGPTGGGARTGGGTAGTATATGARGTP